GGSGREGVGRGGDPGGGGGDGGNRVNEPKEHRSAWTDERGTSEEGRRCVKGAPEASGRAQSEPAGGAVGRLGVAVRQVTSCGGRPWRRRPRPGLPPSARC